MCICKNKINIYIYICDMYACKYKYIIIISNIVLSYDYYIIITICWYAQHTLTPKYPGNAQDLRFPNRAKANGSTSMPFRTSKQR